jgi:hypothetical protein
VTASGALNGEVGNLGGYLFRKLDAPFPSTHSVTVSRAGLELAGIDCDDSDSAVVGNRVDYRVNEGELVTCTVTFQLIGDRDNDGISDDADECPDDPVNLCADRDGDGIPNREDPCPDDAGNTCEPGGPGGGGPGEPGGEGRCRPFRIDVVGDVAGLDLFRFNTSGTVCPGELAGGPTIAEASLNRDGEVVLDAGLMAVLSPVFTFSYDHDANGSPNIVSGTAEFDGTFDLCATILPPGLGAVAGKGLAALFGMVGRFGGDRLIGKAATLWVKAYTKLVEKTASLIGGSRGEALAEAVVGGLVGNAHIALIEWLTTALRGRDFQARMCVPMWEVNVTAAPVSEQGQPKVFYTVDDQGAPGATVVVDTNAESI